MCSVKLSNHIHFGLKSSDLNIQTDVCPPLAMAFLNSKWNIWPGAIIQILANSIFAISLIWYESNYFGRVDINYLVFPTTPTYLYFKTTQYHEVLQTITRYFRYSSLKILNHKTPPTDSAATHPRDMAFYFS